MTISSIAFIAQLLIPSILLLTHSHMKCTNCVSVCGRTGFKPAKHESFVSLSLSIPTTSIGAKMSSVVNGATAENKVSVSMSMSSSV